MLTACGKTYVTESNVCPNILIPTVKEQEILHKYIPSFNRLLSEQQCQILACKGIELPKGCNNANKAYEPLIVHENTVLAFNDSKYKGVGANALTRL